MGLLATGSWRGQVARANSGCTTKQAKNAARILHESATADELHARFDGLEKVVPKKDADYLWDHQHDTTAMMV